MPYCEQHEEPLYFRSNSELDQHMATDHPGQPTGVEFRLLELGIVHCGDRHGRIVGGRLVVEDGKDQSYNFCPHCFGEWLARTFPVSGL